MCGIAGIVDFDRATSHDRLVEQADAMGSCLVHRGPDDSGTWIDAAAGVALSHRRLAIIDVSGMGHQPMVSHCERYVLTYNGELYNTAELREELATTVPFRGHSDTEVLLAAISTWGVGAALERLNGMFALGVWDRVAHELTLARDRLGEKPLYYALTASKVVFGSQLGAVRLGTGGRATIDRSAIAQLLATKSVPAPYTAVEGVNKLPPGTSLTIRRDNATRTQPRAYWSARDVARRGLEHPFPGTAGDAGDELDRLLRDAVSRRMVSDVPLGAFLSGGVDSSTIVGLMARHVQQPVKTFCIGFADPRFDESGFAAQAAQRFGCEHTSEIAELNMLARWPQVLHHLDQPHGDASFMPTLRVSELAARHVKVVLTGDGGDELFAGYDKYADFLGRPGVAQTDDETFRRGYFDSISLFQPAAKQGLYRPEVAARLAGIDSYRAAAQPWFEQAAHFDRVNQALYLDMQLLLSGNNLVKPDRMGMAVSIEAMLAAHRDGTANHTRELRALAALALWDAGRERVA